MSRIGYAVSTDDVITRLRLGPVVMGEVSKDHALFPERGGGRIVAVHHCPPFIWLVFSRDMRSWEDHVVVMRPRWATCSTGR